MLRLISVFLRALQKRKETKRTLAQFEQWRQAIAAMPAPAAKSKRLLIIRLDDIGDYLLFRNTLSEYKRKWPGYEITLLGFSLWKELFEFADSQFVDKTIWINKHEALRDETTLRQLWQKLRNEGFEIVVCPSRVRPLLLDDLFMLAAAPQESIATNNDFSHRQWNEVSDKLYSKLFIYKELSHEFSYNQAFAQWLFPGYTPMLRPAFPAPQLPGPCAEPYVVCFIGASFKSRRWPPERWIEFINTCKATAGYKVVIAGGKNDLPVAEKIIASTNVESITGKVSLVEMVNWLAHSQATVSNDTMAAHLSVALGKPTVIIASGDNFYKFSEYKMQSTTTLYPEVFYKKWKKGGFKPFRNYVAVTKDISTIAPASVFEHLDEMINPTNPGYHSTH